MAEALLVGLVSGVLSGGLVAVFIARWWRPRIRHFEWIKTDFVPDRQVTGDATPLGQLYKLRFLIEGRSSPEWGAVEIEWRSEHGSTRRRVFAKWDDRGMPLEAHDPDQFRPERVPDTYYQPLLVRRTYEVPILFRERTTGRLDVFSGWWFGRNRGYKDFALGLDADETQLWIRVVGANGLDKLIEVSARDVLTKALDARDARASVVQGRLRASLLRRGAVSNDEAVRSEARERPPSMTRSTQPKREAAPACSRCLGGGPAARQEPGEGPTPLLIALPGWSISSSRSHYEHGTRDLHVPRERRQGRCSAFGR